jgi:hypothetical protein
MALQRRLPISARHTFALAFDLAVRRDPLQSLWVPLFLHAPWVTMQAMLPAPDEPHGMNARNLLLQSVVLLGEFLVTLLVAGMLRFRARSVFNTDPGQRPISAIVCYGQALMRLPWLFVTEVARNVAIFATGLLLVLPGVWVGFRLSLATEAAVLREGNVVQSFERSFQLTEGRLERWLEMIAWSVVLALGLLFTLATLFFAWPGSSWSTWVTAGLFLLPLVMTIIQYAWTFFFLRLDELDLASDDGPGEAPEAAAGDGGNGAPRLRVVEGGRPVTPSRH